MRNNPDLYQSFSQLSTKEVYGQGGYHITYESRNSSIILLAIHGGGIEPGTSELAKYLAKIGDYSYYCFEGWKTKGNFETLHITSKNFDEPRALKMVEESEITVSFHGYEDNKVKQTLLGGIDRDLRQKIFYSLLAHGFDCRILSDCESMSGVASNNITNKNKRGKGVQLEISTRQRNAFFEQNSKAKRIQTQTEEFYDYIEAIHSVLP